MFILHSDVTLLAYNLIGIGASFFHPIDRSIVSYSSVQFVNDTSEFLNPLGIAISRNFTIDKADSQTIQVLCEHTRILGALVKHPQGNLEEIQQRRPCRAPKRNL
jgi:hypothetical protein